MNARTFLVAGLLTMTSLLSCAGGLYVETEPPPLRAEVRPAPPGPNAVWIDGYWDWRARQYVWIEGHWDRHPRGNWVPGRWEKQERGYVWVRGYWENNSRERDRDRNRNAN
jgi:hypothetical protein